MFDPTAPPSGLDGLAVEAALEAGDTELAERLVARLGITAPERGLVLAARGDLAGGRAAVHAALARRPDGPFALARALLILGRIERRAKRRSHGRAALAHAAALFASIPAPGWEAKARAELRRLGLRAPLGGLTVTERQIAELAAAGLTNPEIAARVFVSRKTVEANLSAVYRKLGVRSRVDLARDGLAGA
jgi:DNA-binding NarL/FixJ family response regulator